MGSWWKNFSLLSSLLWLILFSAPSLCAKWVSICSLFAPFPFVVSLTPLCPRQPVFASENWFQIWEGSYQNPPNPLMEKQDKCFANDTHLVTSMVRFPSDTFCFSSSAGEEGSLKAPLGIFSASFQVMHSRKHERVCDLGILVPALSCSWPSGFLSQWCTCWSHHKVAIALFWNASNPLESWFHLLK